MNAETRQRLCDAELVRIREAHLERLAALFAGERLDRAFVLQGLGAGSCLDPFTQPTAWVTEALDNLAGHADVARDTVVFRPLCIEQFLCGVHFTDRLFGAEVWFQDGQWWSLGLRTPVGELQAPDLAAAEVWQQARRLTDAMVAADVTVPLFTTQVLGAPLNQAFNIYKDNLLFAFYDAPDAVRRDLRVITDTLIAMHRWYRATIPFPQLQGVIIGGRCQPHGFGQMCGCATQLVSGELYREFIAPLDEELLSVYPGGGMYHLCGAHTQHIPVWREMQKLRAIQVNDRAAEDLETYFLGLRDDQIIYLNPTRSMTIDRALAITGGRRLVIVADVKDPPKVHPP